MTDVINLYGGPGTGKSTFGAYAYYLLKKAGGNAELVREYVKDWAWEGRQIGPFDQLYFLGKHVRKETMLFGKVDVVVTDSPVFLTVLYSRMYSPDIAPSIEAAVRGYYDAVAKSGNTYHHIFLNRIKPYLAAGRYQTEEEARDLDKVTLDLLDEFGLPYTQIDADEASIFDYLHDHNLLGE